MEVKKYEDLVMEYGEELTKELLETNEKVEKLAKKCEEKNENPENYYNSLVHIWLNKSPGVRCPLYFNDLRVPNVFREIFNDIFIDF